MAKRVSTEEKLQKIIEFFTSSSDVYVIKELEKKIPKQCGISGMLVKDLLTNLQNDYKINVEKCGISNYYWKFKYEKHHTLQCKNEKMRDEITKFTKENDNLTKQIATMKENRKDTEVRRDLMDEYTCLKVQTENLQNVKDLAQTCSRKLYDELENTVVEHKTNINKLTDDIFTLQSYVCDKLNIDKNAFNSNFQIHEELDYVEE